MLFLSGTYVAITAQKKSLKIKHCSTTINHTKSGTWKTLILELKYWMIWVAAAAMTWSFRDFWILL